MMNRRRFVKTLGTSAISSGWLLGGGPPPSNAHPPSKAALTGEKIAPPAAPPQGVLWPRPVIVPLPTEVAGVSQPLVDLGGTWKVTTSPPADYGRIYSDPSGWTDIKVPGELTAQGITFARDNEVAYQRSVQIPIEAKGHTVLLRFNGVYSYARVWVNGKFVREHHGGFTSWDCDITKFVTPGETAWLSVGVTDRADEISYASNYAKHFVGGILRSVKLIILPAVHLTRLHVETGFDSTFKDARLKVVVALSAAAGRDCKLNLHLTDPMGKSVSLYPATLAIPAIQSEAVIEIPISAPMKWDSERPNLYTLAAEMVVHKTAIEKIEKKVGFRKVERRGNKLYVNGDPVKLRGVCRHDTHALLGRVSTPEQDEKDAILLRDGNINFVRTSHYPPAETFLEACDKYGVYVEEESAVCFVRQQWSVTGGGSESDPDFTSRYMNQFTEMVERDRSHPSVIFWSLGNESAWGTNFQREHDYAKREDTTRPIIFSYPRTVPQGIDCYDLYSEHYPKVEGDLTSKEFPKLNDEFGHISCYNHETLMRDPGVRDFYGHSIKQFWENFYVADGCLGGAIWAGFEEVFMLPQGPVGYGEWGMVDGWRRPKPEYWLTQKAYSPVRIPDEDITDVPSAGSPLELPVKNWFNHANLGELQILWAVGRDTGELRDLNIGPGGQGTIRIPGRNWKTGETLNLKFLHRGDVLVDEFNLRLGKRVVRWPEEKGPAPKITEDSRSLTVQGSEFTLVFDKVTGLIAGGTYRGKRIIEAGPYLNLGSDPLPPWWLTSLSHSATADTAVISPKGAYMALNGGGRVLGVEFEIRIDGQGLITTQYSVRGQPKGMSEVGIAFILSKSIGRLTWDRKALWSAYPSDHIGRPQGTAQRESSSPVEKYRTAPTGPWSQDSKDFCLFGRDDPGGRGTNDFRSLKENIWRASCVLAESDLRVRAEADGTAAARAEVLPDGRVQFHIDNLWGYPDLAWGNYCPPIDLPNSYQNTVRLRLTDNDEA